MAGIGAIGSPRHWAVLLVLLLALLVFDLGIARWRAHRESFAEALFWSLFWTALGALFGLWIYLRFGAGLGLEFATAYLVERALSFDNLFVFLVLFDALAVPRERRRRVLHWGILGALLTRGLFIALGAALLARAAAVLLVFGIFLLVTGLRLLFRPEMRHTRPKSRMLGFFERFVPLTSGFRGERFMVREGGRLLATPLLLALLAIEASDVAFALDSIPAVFGVTRSPFIAFSSNAFAIFGLRSLYFVVQRAMVRFRYLEVGIGLVLVFVGAKMLAAHWIEIPAGVALAVIFILVGAALAVSLLRPPVAAGSPPPGSPPPDPRPRPTEIQEPGALRNHDDGG